MASLEGLRDELRAELADLKFQTVLVRQVPPDEFYFVRDLYGLAHTTGPCILRTRAFFTGVTWERFVGRDLSKLTRSCSCVARSRTISLTQDVGVVESVLKSNALPRRLLRADNYSSLLSTFPAVYEIWERVQRLYWNMVLSDPNLLKLRAVAQHIHGFYFPVSQLPSAGVCTLQHKHPTGLDVFPNGVSSIAPWVALPEDAAMNLWRASDEYTLVGVEGWPVERVEVVSTLIREAGSKEEALATFKLAEQLVP